MEMEMEAMRFTEDELSRIVAAGDLRIAPLRDDGKTPGTPTWIWCVAVEGELYVRAYNGQRSRWYQAAARQRAGRITAAGMTRDVAFDLVDGSINGRMMKRTKPSMRPAPTFDQRSARVLARPR